MMFTVQSRSFIYNDFNRLAEVQRVQLINANPGTFQAVSRRALYDVVDDGLNVLFTAEEDTPTARRICCGVNRDLGLQFTVGRRKIMRMERGFSLGTGCVMFVLIPMTMKVFVPPRILIGEVRQPRMSTRMELEIIDSSINRTVFWVQAPDVMCNCNVRTTPIYRNYYRFSIIKKDDGPEIGAIVFPGDQESFTLPTDSYGINFPMYASVREKILLLTAAFLLDMNYNFQSRR